MGLPEYSPKKYLFEVIFLFAGKCRQLRAYISKDETKIRDKLAEKKETKREKYGIPDSVSAGGWRQEKEIHPPQS